MMTGVNMVHVPYRGSAPMVADLLSGHVQVAFDTMTTSLPHIRSGALRALAVAGKTRFAGLPDVPTVSDVVPGCEASAWQGVGIPRGTPNEITERLNREINDGLASPVIKTRLADAAAMPMVFTPAEFGTYMAAETEKWGKVVRAANIKAEGSQKGDHRPKCREGTMKLPHRRQFLHLAAGAAALPAVSRISWAQNYPTRPVRIIVGFAAGGATDILARLLGQVLSERLGQQFVI